MPVQTAELAKCVVAGDIFSLIVLKATCFAPECPGRGFQP